MEKSIYYVSKGITPVIAIVLLLMVTIALVGFSFVWFQGVFQQTAETAGRGVEHQSAQIGTNFRIDNADNFYVAIRNSDINALSGLEFYIDDSLVPHQSHGDVTAGGTGVFFLLPVSVDLGSAVELQVSTGVVVSKKSYAFDNAAPNPSWEWDAPGTSAPTGWQRQAGSPEIVNTEARSGSQSIYFPGGGLYSRIRSIPKINFQPGDKIFGRLYYKGDGTQRLYFGIYYCETSSPSYQYFASGSSNTNGQWRELNGTLTIPAGKTCGYIWLFNFYTNTGPVWVDDVYVTRTV